MTCDLSDPELAKAYNEIRKPSANISWLVAGYNNSRDKISVYQIGKEGFEEMKEYVLSHDEVLYIYIRIKNKFALITFISEKATGVKRARALVHSRAIGNLFMESNLQITITSASELTEQNFKTKLRLDSSYESLAQIGLTKQKSAMIPDTGPALEVRANGLPSVPKSSSFRNLAPLKPTGSIPKDISDMSIATSTSDGAIENIVPSDPEENGTEYNDDDDDDEISMKDDDFSPPKSQLPATVMTPEQLPLPPPFSKPEPPTRSIEKLNMLDANVVAPVKPHLAPPAPPPKSVSIDDINETTQTNSKSAAISSSDFQSSKNVLKISERSANQAEEIQESSISLVKETDTPKKFESTPLPPSRSKSSLNSFRRGSSNANIAGRADTTEKGDERQVIEVSPLKVKSEDVNLSNSVLFGGKPEIKDKKEVNTSRSNLRSPESTVEAQLALEAHHEKKVSSVSKEKLAEKKEDNPVVPPLKPDIPPVPKNVKEVADVSSSEPDIPKKAKEVAEITPSKPDIPPVPKKVKEIANIPPPKPDIPKVEEKPPVLPFKRDTTERAKKPLNALTNPTKKSMETGSLEDGKFLTESSNGGVTWKRRSFKVTSQKLEIYSADDNSSLIRTIERSAVIDIEDAEDEIVIKNSLKFYLKDGKEDGNMGDDEYFVYFDSRETMKEFQILFNIS